MPNYKAQMILYSYEPWIYIMVYSFNYYISANSKTVSTLFLILTPPKWSLL